MTTNALSIALMILPSSPSRSYPEMLREYAEAQHVHTCVKDGVIHILRITESGNTWEPMPLTYQGLREWLGKAS
jgi:hypothetical protein